VLKGIIAWRRIVADHVDCCLIADLVTVVDLKKSFCR
jgi:hypothetical protein